MEVEKKITVSEDAFTENLKVRSFLGQGGVGRVFLGIEKNLDREVAIKELIPERLGQNREKKIARFVREAKLAGKLQHPGVIPVYSLVKRDDGTYYYVMKYVHGRTLADAIQACNALKETEAFARRMTLLDKVIAVCEAMAYAHSKGVVHRDLKPSNIILGDFGETIILDWGLAKEISEKDTRDTEEPVELSGNAELDADAKLTRDGAIVGTPAYLAPEQIFKEKGPVDQRTDVYTLGVMLFMLLAGRRPYLGNTREVLQAIISPEITPSPSEHCNCVPPELLAICNKAMSKDRDKRFADASELANELRAYRDGRLVSVYAYSAGELFRRFIARNKAAIAATAAVVIAIIVGAGFSLHFAIDAQKARLRAENALVEVTGLSETSMELARRASTVISDIVRKKGWPETVGALRAEVIRALDFDPATSPYQIWCMDDDGTILYDEDQKQVGKHLFTDEMYAGFPELLALGARIRAEPFGVGYYRFEGKDGAGIIYKIAAWDTVDLPKNESFKLVATHPYMVK